jgi:hypothetical protein
MEITGFITDGLIAFLYSFFKLDIDECRMTRSNTCDVTKATCENTDGSYICNCFEGYRKLNSDCNGMFYAICRDVLIFIW